MSAGDYTAPDKRILAVRAALTLVRGGFSIETAAAAVAGVTLDDVLSAIGAFPDRPVLAPRRTA